MALYNPPPGFTVRMERDMLDVTMGGWYGHKPDPFTKLIPGPPRFTAEFERGGVTEVWSVSVDVYDQIRALNYEQAIAIVEDAEGAGATRVEVR